MRSVYLIFPDSSSLAEFVGAYQVSRSQVNSRDMTLTGILTEDAIIAAKKEFKADEIPPEPQVE